MKKLDLTNQRFGKLVVLNQSNVKYSDGIRWVCNCDCGKIAIVRTNHLRNGRTNSCGCLYKKYSATFESAYIGYFNNYMVGAKNRNIEFRLTFEQFVSIIEKSCYYCGTTDNVIRITIGIQKGLKAIANGVDRVNNTLGYTVDNCVPACAMCNYMKRDYTIEQFLTHITKIHQFMTMEQPHFENSNS